MRQLTADQKQILANAFKNYRPMNWLELRDDDIEVLEQLNDTEILAQEVDRYLHDIYWADEKTKPAWLK